MDSISRRHSKAIIEVIPYELRSLHQYTMYIRDNDGSVRTKEFSASTKENAERYVNRGKVFLDVVSWV